MNHERTTIHSFDTAIKMPFIMLPVRSILIDVEGQSILHSPGSRLTSDDFGKMKKVNHLIAPSFFHTAGIEMALSHFPDATLWLPQVAFEKLQASIPEKINKANVCIFEKSDWTFKDSLPRIQLEGIPKISENVFFHLESKSLIVSDLCFNLLGIHGIAPKIIFGMFGTYDQFAVSRFFMSYVKNKNLFQKSLDQIFQWDFEKIIMGHGLIVDSNAKGLLKEAFQKRGYFV